MPTLAQQARWIPRARRWLAATAVLAGLGILAGQVLPRFARLTQLCGANQQAMRQLADAQAEVASLRTVLQPISVAGATPPRSGRIHSVGDAILPLRGGVALDPESWVRLMTDMSQNCGLQGVTVQTGVPQQNGAIRRLPLVLNFDGDYLDACSFLEDAERLPAVVRISTLHVRCTNLPTGQVEVQVAMNAYMPENP
ncbi:MAG TPA: hypothetical protein VHY37_13380 [Tepidisphaeraceae bacterium]|jgi:hypothetical protein|nr:hypothetical protein [Tepidisphaeraceae bacterium]